MLKKNQLKKYMYIMLLAGYTSIAASETEVETTSKGQKIADAVSTNPPTTQTLLDNTNSSIQDLDNTWSAIKKDAKDDITLAANIVANNANFYAHFGAWVRTFDEATVALMKDPWQPIDGLTQQDELVVHTYYTFCSLLKDLAYLTLAVRDKDSMSNEDYILIFGELGSRVKNVENSLEALKTRLEAIIADTEFK